MPFVDETILAFDAPKSAGAKQLVKESIGCTQGDSPSQGSDANGTRWLRTESGSRLALVESGSWLIAVECADASAIGRGGAGVSLLALAEVSAVILTCHPMAA